MKLKFKLFTGCPTDCRLCSNFILHAKRKTFNCQAVPKGGRYGGFAITDYNCLSLSDRPCPQYRKNDIKL